MMTRQFLTHCVLFSKPRWAPWVSTCVVNFHHNSSGCNFLASCSEVSITWTTWYAQIAFQGQTCVLWPQAGDGPKINDELELFHAYLSRVLSEAMPVHLPATHSKFFHHLTTIMADNLMCFTMCNYHTPVLKPNLSNAASACLYGEIPSVKPRVNIFMSHGS